MIFVKGWRYRPNLVINIPACQLLIHLKLNLMRHFLYLFYMQYISHDFVTEDIKQELLPSTVTKKGSTIKTNCSDLILKPKLGSNNHIHHLKSNNTGQMTKELLKEPCGDFKVLRVFMSYEATGPQNTLNRVSILNSC